MGAHWQMGCVCGHGQCLAMGIPRGACHTRTVTRGAGGDRERAEPWSQQEGGLEIEFGGPCAPQLVRLLGGAHPPTRSPRPMAFLTPPVLSQESPALMAGGIWSTPNSPFPLQNPTDEQLRGQIHQNRETPGGRQGLGTRWGGGRCRATLRHLWPLPVPEFMEVWWLVPRMGRNPTLGTGHILVGGCPGTAPPPRGQGSNRHGWGAVVHALY